MKKNIILTILSIIVLILIAATCQAAVVYDDTVADNTPFFINSIKHISKYYPAAEKASIAAGDNRVLVAKGSCETIGDMQYCVDDATTGYDDETGSSVSSIKLRVMEFGPEVQISRSISEDEPLLNEDVTVTVTLNNIGTERATGITYEDKYPTEVKMQGSTVNRAINAAEWSGSLDPGKSHTFSYTLKFEDFLKYKSKAKASYPYKSKLKIVYSKEVEFNVARTYEINTTISGRSFTNDDTIVYTVSVKNNGEETLRVNPLMINLPDGFTVTKRDVGIEGTGKQLTWKGELSQGNSESFEIKFKTTKKGEFQIKTDFALTSGKFQFTDTTEEKFRVGISEIEAIVKAEPAEVKAGGEVMVEVGVQNIGESTINVDAIDFVSDMDTRRGWRNEQLNPGKKFYALNKIIYAPIIYEEKTYSWTISGHYTSAGGKKFEFSGTATLNVLPFEKVVDFDEKYFVVNESGEYKYLNVTVMVTNVKDYTMKELNIIDGLPKGFKMVAGSRDYEGDKLNPGASAEYSYVFRMPKETTKFEIKHTFNAVGNSDEKLIFEMPKEIDMVGDKAEMEEMKAEAQAEEKTAEESAQETETAGPETVTEEKKPGIFRRMWNWFKGLFGGKDKEEKPAEQTAQETTTEKQVMESEPTSPAEEAEGPAAEEKAADTAEEETAADEGTVNLEDDIEVLG
ncbi:TPA: DUF11 domain-containing protein [Candidatus Woesearchaeota archaeon]|nr:DUF11 domain-containing protein [Candidatus Woesearchaeota archaeon]